MDANQTEPPTLHHLRQAQFQREHPILFWAFALFKTEKIGDSGKTMYIYQNFTTNTSVYERKI
jgi:hypothetical protein